MSLLLPNSLGTFNAHAHFISLCHVERLNGEICCSVSLGYLSLSGVETSAYAERCFDSASCEFTTVLINCEHNAWVAQHDKQRRHRNVDVILQTSEGTNHA